MRESAIERKVCQFAKDNGITTIKLGGAHNRGKPDRLFLYRGKAVFLELKAPGKKPTELQKHWMCKLEAGGFKAAWTDNVGTAIEWLKMTLLDYEGRQQ